MSQLPNSKNKPDMDEEKTKELDLKYDTRQYTESLKLDYCHVQDIKFIKEPAQDSALTDYIPLINEVLQVMYYTPPNIHHNIESLKPIHQIQNKLVKDENGKEITKKVFQVSHTVVALIRIRGNPSLLNLKQYYSRNQTKTIETLSGGKRLSKLGYGKWFLDDGKGKFDGDNFKKVALQEDKENHEYTIIFIDSPAIYPHFKWKDKYESYEAQHFFRLVVSSTFSKTRPTAENVLYFIVIPWETYKTVNFVEIRMTSQVSDYEAIKRTWVQHIMTEEHKSEEHLKSEEHKSEEHKSEEHLDAMKDAEGWPYHCKCNIL